MTIKELKELLEGMPEEKEARILDENLCCIRNIETGWCDGNGITLSLAEGKSLLKEGDSIDIAVNDDISVHVYRSDCGYVIDVWPQQGNGDDLVNTMTIWDDDLIQDEKA